MDFYEISITRKTNGVVEIRPDFNTGKQTDLMTRGGDFYAVWLEDKKLWSTDEDDVIKMIDKDLRVYVKEHAEELSYGYSAKYMRKSSSGSIDQWHKYVKQQQRDNFVPLDGKLIFANQETTKESYASKKLPYALEDGSIESYDKLMSVLYSPEERRKLEWAIGAIVSGDSVNIQKFIVLYGDKGTGKGTFIKIVQKLFDGYCESFSAAALGDRNNQFALEPFKNDPLVAIDSDGDLSRVNDNTRLNALTSHEYQPLNSKYEKIVSAKLKAFLFIGSNKPVAITDAKSGLLRRLIDVSPTGRLVTGKEYKRLMKNIDYELGAIAKHCLDIYLEEPDRYDDYIPSTMMAYTNDFYNFIIYNIDKFEESDGISMAEAWHMYGKYCDETNTKKVLMRTFREELKNYFDIFEDRATLDDGTIVRSYYRGFRIDKFSNKKPKVKEEPDIYEINFKSQKSLLDEYLKDCLAQYAYISGSNDRPEKAWDNCTTTLKDLDTGRLHYILPTGHENLIRLDFDIRNEKGEKDPDLNLKEASKWPRTYAERSKSGAGIHLYYIYTGDPKKLQQNITDEIEIKIVNGKSAIRRKLTVCNDIPINTISSGLPLKGERKKMVDPWTVKSDQDFERFIKDCFQKKHHGNTMEEINFIYKVLEDKYNSGEPYDYTRYFNDINTFACASTNSHDRAIKVVRQMHFKSKEPVKETLKVADPFKIPERPLVIFDCEVFPNLLVICWKFIGSDNPVHAMVNPSPEEVAHLMENRLIGFNNLHYDNHILYARRIGQTFLDIYKLSQAIIQFGANNGFPQSKEVSYTDIFDYCATKQSLKKWEIAMSIHHQELSLKWDEPVDQKDFDMVTDYCKNDVKATEALWFFTQGDFLARQILADLTGMTVNDSTNSLTGRLIFGNNRHPQSQFNYRNLSLPVLTDEKGVKLPEDKLIFTAWNGEKSAKPFFPGYKFENGKSTYRGEEIGEGGRVYAEPGIYYDVPVFDVTSMHPHSIIAERLFGPYTDIFEELVKARVHIKHAVSSKKNGDEEGYKKALEEAVKLEHLGSKLSRYLDDFDKLKNLPQALKIAINSVYGLTSAKFSNPCKDPRNVDNIVAKRGALFMTDLKFAVQEKGFTVAHIKTDSIKIPGATPEIKKFVEDFGKMYGYSFEVEDDYEKICLVNDAVYIAKYKEPQFNDETKQFDIWWSATGTQFQVPYVFKTLFSGEKIEFNDLCETKSVKSALYLDFNEGLEDQELMDQYKNLLKLQRSGQDMHVELENVQKIMNERLHRYSFVGKVGQFCPVKPGYGGGELLREQNGKYYAATGTKGFRWKDAEVLRGKDLDYQIDTTYYDILCEKAVEAINETGKPFGVTFDDFVNDNFAPKVGLSVSEMALGDQLPFESDDNLPF